jgi:hypothetical protein
MSYQAAGTVLTPGLKPCPEGQMRNLIGRCVPQEIRLCPRSLCPSGEQRDPKTCACKSPTLGLQIQSCPPTCPPGHPALKETTKNGKSNLLPALLIGGAVLLAWGILR